MHYRTDGFTLVEMAMVLIIIGLVMLAVFPALMAFRTGTQRSVTQSNLQALMTATAAYVQANGCVPCPTAASATGSAFGVVANYSSATPCGSCTKTTAEGIPPFSSLGIPASTAHDGGGHWITMRVDPALTTNFGIAPPTKPIACACSTPSGNVCTPTPSNCTCATAVNATCTPLPAGLSQQGLCASGLASTNRITIQTPGGSTQQAAVIFVSHGINGYGSYSASSVLSPYGTNGSPLPFPASYASCAAGGYARCNGAATNSTTFYNAPIVVGGSTAYDDTLAFADRNTLVSMFGNGSCQTVW